MKRIMIYGSSGSVGISALKVLRKDRANFKVEGLLVNRNIEVLKKQIKEFVPKYICVVDQVQANMLKGSLGKGIRLFIGEEGVREFASIPTDIALMGIVGISSLSPLLLSLQYARRVLLASKETLVVGGHLVKKFVRNHRVELIPIDSEINAVFQLMRFIKKKLVKKVYLTASGGPLRNYSLRQIRQVTKQQVLAHPTWKMGQRISVDSATLVNKGFEVMEVHHLFNLAYSQIEVVVHKESYIHAMIEMKDNTFFTCVYPPSMMIPIAHALYYPDRNSGIEGDKMSFNNLSLTFNSVDNSKFPLLQIVRDAAEGGGNLPVVVNAADEVAVQWFLNNRITFSQMSDAVQTVFLRAEKTSAATLEEVMFWDSWARNKTNEYCERLSVKRKG